MTTPGGRGPLVLRDYQQAAVDAVTPTDPRALIAACCGSGKTLIAVRAAAKLLDGNPGAALVLLPTLGLLDQTYRVWKQEAPLPFSALAVCSINLVDPEDISADELSIESTTEPDRLGQWLTETPGTRVVFATYQSMPVIAEMHRNQPGQRWTVIVADEAHHTAGRHGKPFAAALHDSQIPARHRLFFTATPKIDSRPRAGREHKRTVASMDDTDLYGRRVFSLGTREAIDRGILSDFKVAVIAVANTEVAAALRDLRLITLAGGEDTPARADHVATAIALIQAASAYELSSVLAFHNTIAASQDFTRTFRGIHALMASRGLTRTGKQAHITHVDGHSKLTERHAAVNALAQRSANTWHVVSNARALAEGVNIPALDAVLFAEPRNSQIDVAQAVGRAIRRNPHHSRPALVILAVTVDDRQDAQSVIEVSEFKKARQALRALEGHDPSIAINLAHIRETVINAKPDSDGLIESDLLDLHLPTDLPAELAEKFLQAFSVHTVDELTVRWDTQYASLVDYAATHGHASPPQDYVTADGTALGQWVCDQRRRVTHGRLSVVRRHRLESLPGWAWNAVDARWETNFAALTAYANEHGHAYPPRSHTTDGINLNQWVIGLRRPGRREKLTDERIKRLESLPGWTWHPRQTSTWEPSFAALADYAATHGHTTPPLDLVTDDGIPLGAWVAEMRQPSRSHKLAHSRRRRLESLPGWTWTPTTTPRNNTPRTAADWTTKFQTLSDYVTEHGHASPPATTTHAGTAIGRWVTEQRRAHRNNTLTPEHTQLLQTLPGWAWTANDARWEQNFAALAAYTHQHSNTAIPPDYRSDAGTGVATWLHEIRSTRSRDTLTPDRRTRLETLPGWTWARTRNDHSWDDAYQELVDWVDEHGHASPTQSTRTPTGLALGHWISAQRVAYKNGTMATNNPDRITRLQALPGWAWDAFDARWEHGYAELHHYTQQHSQATPANRTITPSGYRLGQWAQEQRLKHRRGQLNETRTQRLETLPGWTWTR